MKIALNMYRYNIFCLICITLLSDPNADNDKNLYANRRSENIYMMPINDGIPPPVPGAPVWSTEENTAYYTKST